GDEFRVQFHDVEAVAGAELADDLLRHRPRARPDLEDPPRPALLPHWPRQRPSERPAAGHDRPRRGVAVAELPVEGEALRPVTHAGLGVRLRQPWCGPCAGSIAFFPHRATAIDPRPTGQYWQAPGVRRAVGSASLGVS